MVRIAKTRGMLVLGLVALLLTGVLPIGGAEEDPLVPGWVPAVVHSESCLPGVAVASQLVLQQRCPVWTTRHDEPATGPDDVGDVAVNPVDGTVYVTGLTEDGGGNDAVTIALDPATGLVQWTSRVDLTRNEWGKQVAVAPDGDTVYVGGVDGQNILVFALDAATGDLGWTYAYEGPAGAGGLMSDLTASNDGERIYLTAESWGGTTRNDATTVALDAATGTQLWEDRLNGPADKTDQANALVESPDGQTLYVTGDVQVGSIFFQRDILTIAYDAKTGTRQWVTTHALGDGADGADAISVSPDGATVVVTGTTVITGLDYATVAYDAATGAVLWDARYAMPGTGRDMAAAVAITPDGERVIVTGGSDQQASSNEKWRDVATVAYDLVTGTELWSARYDGEAGGYDAPDDMVLTPDGRLAILTGNSLTGPDELFPEGPGRDALTLAYDVEDGTLVWEARYNGPLQRWDTGKAIAVAPDGSRAFIAGSAEGTDGTDYLVLAYETAV